MRLSNAIKEEKADLVFWNFGVFYLIFKYLKVQGVQFILNRFAWTFSSLVNYSDLIILISVNLTKTADVALIIIFF